MPTPKEVRDLNYLSITSYIRHLKVIIGLSDNTVKSYRTQMNSFSLWLETLSTVTVFEVNSGHVINYAEWLQVRNTRFGKKGRRGSIKLALNILRYYYDYLIERGEVDRMPVVRKLMKRNLKTKKDYLTPTYEQISRIRRAIELKWAIRHAAYFELSMSTGMRRTEVLQIRKSDLVHAPSEFLWGYIDLKVSLHKIKRWRERRVYVGKLAGAVLETYIQETGIEGDMPLFPYEQNTPNTWLKKIGLGIMFKESSSQQPRARDIGLRDIERTDIARAPAGYRRSLAARQRRANKEEKQNPLVDKLEEPDVQRHMHPHSLRHVFGSTMYYMDWSGRKNDLLKVRDLMGHASVTSTYIYLSMLHVVQNDSDWRLMWLGRPNEYLRLGVDNDG